MSNELTDETNGGTLTVMGTTTTSARGVTVNGSNAVLYGDSTFAAAIAGTTGGSATPAITVNLARNTGFQYDLNGNKGLHQVGAAAYIGVDCDMTHLAALLEVKTVAIHSQFPASFLWPCSNVESASPKTACVYCRFQEDRGYLPSCDSACSALATVGPETVMSTVLKLLEKP